MNIKKSVLLLLAAAMLSFVLPSCGKSPENNTDIISAESGIVWRGERTYIDGINGIADNFLYRDGRVYFKTTEYPDGRENADGSRITITLHSVNTDGGDLTSIPLIDGKDKIFDCFTLDRNGNIVLVETVSNADTQESRSFYLKKYSPDGTEIFSHDITDSVRSFADEYFEYFYVGSIAVDGNDNIYISNYSFAAAFSPEGELVFGRQTENDGIRELAVSASGEVYGRIYSDGYVLKRIDPVTGELGSEIKMSDTQYDYRSTAFSGAGDDEIYVDNGTSLTVLDPESGKLTEILNWVDSDLIRDEIGSIFPDENGSGFVCAGLSYPAENPIITVISPHDASELPKRTELVMAGSEYAVDFALEYMAVKFNTENENYRIKIKKYSGEDYLAGLNADILSGNIPDIIITDTGMNPQSYISKGLFLDMYPFIDGDSELDRSDLLPNVLSAFETDGKLYSFTDSFMIQTVLGKASIFKEKGIDFASLARIREQFPDDTEIFAGMSKNDVLQKGLQTSADIFIDYPAGECRFDTDEFIALLEFANTFPSDADIALDDGFWQRLDVMYFDESTLLMSPLISCYGDFYCYEHGYFSDTVTAVGFPSLSGKPGSSIFFDSGFAISARSEHPEGAWQFVRTLLLPEHQDAAEDFPVRRSSLESKARKEMDLGSDDVYYAMITMGDLTLTSGKFVSEIGTPSQSDIDRINDLVTSVSRLDLYNSTVREIVNEEASAYFSGSKTAKEAAEMIQSRVKLYLSEIS